jgi:hypothetical protein
MWSITSTASWSQDADVLQAHVADAFEQCADTGRMHFAAQEAGLRQRGGDLGTGLPHPEADFQHSGCFASSFWPVALSASA